MAIEGPLQNDIYHHPHGSTRFVKDLTDGWYRRFRERHPRLAPRAAQKVSRARNSVDEGDLRALFHTLAKLAIERRLQPSQVFNMDETSFTSRTNTRKVIAVKGSPNVHTHAPETSFHLSFVAAAAADGFAVPPLFIAPGMRVPRSILDECSIEGAAITTSPEGFINSSIFLEWITHFACNVPDAVPCPLVLVCDGCSSHVDLDTLERSSRRRCVPPIQEGNQKRDHQNNNLHVRDDNLKGDNDLDRQQGVHRPRAAQAAQHRERLQVNGSVPIVYRHDGQASKKFNSSGTKRGDTLGSETWLQIRHEVRTEVLLLPLKRVKMPRKRTTVDVGGRLLTRVLLAADQRKQPDTIRDPVGCTDVVVYY